MMKLKIGDKVRHIESNMEGYVAYSSFGLSINGFTYDGEYGWTHFKTLGEPREDIEMYWKRVYKFKYHMKRYEEDYGND